MTAYLIKEAQDIYTNLGKKGSGSLLKTQGCHLAKDDAVIRLKAGMKKAARDVN
jgi:hypothetical protein